ncbi:DNA-binding SARP family transcriptional activator [Tamaricihabitans halophyticus]|uniref:DNA-binding SARP family transcriptional activator n=1 Tax=Tamaricihabitans halophyticus TaxID=1262583 RepID=A0A4R2QIV3_9PSEU|nr:BTAD domain-containing putative transcriptional regulator [Tamaricihabitans halophyticus]TCP49293.1 DNA-binding SARP family transcriptional activator [Tamaricihabitans halophyticus]
MDFRVLGPLEVWHAGTVTPVTAPMQRALLATLVLRAGDIVSVDAIIDQLWGPEPPDSAHVTVRNYVQRLRKVLPEQVLETTPPGYRLRVNRDTIDANRFTDLASQAREVAAANPVAAAKLFGQALALWRGTPLSDLGDAPIQLMQAPRLEELYLNTLEESIEVRLRLGWHAQLVAELTELTGLYPLRERLCKQLMVALYRCRRSAEALNCYRRIRSRLVAELGIEPGSELRQLEQSILREDLTLSVPFVRIATDQPGRAPAPDELPAPIGTFLGRGTELAELRERFSTPNPAGPPVCMIYGPGGVGKSTVAVQLAHELKASYPDGVLYVDLHGSTTGKAPVEAAEVLRTLLNELGAPETTGDVLAARAYRARLQGRKVLVILDNAGTSSQVIPAIPDDPGCAVIVTSRHPIVGPDGATHIHLDVLPPEQAVALLGRIVGQRRVTAEQHAASRLAALCGHLPLALRIIATRAATRPHWPLQTWVDLLDDERGRLDELSTPDLDIRASILVSIDELTQSTRQDDRRALELFIALGEVAVDAYTPSMAAALTGWSEAAATAGLEQLVDAQLLYSPRPAKYAMYDLVGVLARERAQEQPTEHGLGRARLAAEWYLAAAHDAHRTLTGTGLPIRVHIPPNRTTGFPDRSSALHWLDNELEGIIAVGTRLAATRQRCAPLLTAMLRMLAVYFNTTMQWAQRSALSRLVLDTARQEDDRYGQGVALMNLGVVASQRDQLAEADRYYQHSLAELAESRSDYEYARLLQNLTALHSILGQPQRGEQYAADALHAAREHGYRDLESGALNNLAIIHLRRQEPERARGLLDESVRVAKAIGSHYQLSTALNSLTQVYGAVGDHEQALRCAQEALRTNEGVGNTRQAIECLINLANTLRKLGRLDEARQRYEQARERLAEIGTREQIQLNIMMDHLLRDDQPSAA